MAKRKGIVVVDPNTESVALIVALQKCLESSADTIPVQRDLIERLLRFLRPLGDVSLSEFGLLTPTEARLLTMLLRQSPVLVPLAEIEVHLNISQASIMVHKRRLTVKLLANNERIHEANADRPAEEQRPYTYLIGRAGIGYALVRSAFYYDEDALKTVDFGVHHL
jgi:hypothetical protein